MEIKTVRIDKETHKELKLIAIKTDKKLYELIKDAIPLLKEKFNIGE